MLIELGARPAGEWRSGHMSPIDAQAPDFETPQHEDGRGNTQSRYDYPYGISVNGLGLRFFDEGEAQHSYTYAKTGRAVLGQPGAIAYQIYDQTGIKCFRYPHHKATFVEAGTITELATKAGLEPTVLTHTVEEFNRAVSDEHAFDPRKPDGRATTGLAIPKSNWAMRIDAPPFRAYPVTGGITFTFGGAEVNRQAQVLSTIDQPIKGLFASGDIVGLFFHNYPSFTGQTRNAVFGRLALQRIPNAAKQAAADEPEIGRAETRHALEYRRHAGIGAHDCEKLALLCGAEHRALLGRLRFRGGGRHPAQHRLARGGGFVEAAARAEERGALEAGLVVALRLFDEAAHDDDELIERAFRFRFGRLDQQTLGHQQREVRGRRMKALVEETLGYVHGGDTGLLFQPLQGNDEFVTGAPVRERDLEADAPQLGH
jgi:hypothetical protein